MTKKNNLSKFTATAATAVMVASAIVPTVAGAQEAKVSNSFSDVPSTHTHFDAIEYIKDLGIINGYTDGTFKPYDSVKREHVALMLARALGAVPEGDYADSGFTDVSSNYKWAVDYLFSIGAVHGKSDTHFGGSDPTTRAEMAKIIVNTYDLKANEEDNFKFTDVNKTFKPFVKALVDNKVTVGMTSTQYGSEYNVTRGQLAEFIHRLETEVVAKDLEVKSVVNDNAKEIAINFNTELDTVSASDKSNYVLKVGGKEVTDFQIVPLDGDKKTVNLTLKDDNKIPNKAAVTLEVTDKVKDKSGTKGIEGGFTKTWLFEDEKAPEIESSLVKGRDLVLTFNEYVTKVDTLKIDGKVITSPEAEKESTKTITIKDVVKYSQPGKHEIVLNGVSDISGNKSGVILSYFIVDEDVNSPTVEKIEQKDNLSFEVTFNKEVALVGTENIVVKKNGYVVKAKAEKVDKTNKYLVTLTDEAPVNVYDKDQDSSVIDITVDGYKSVDNDLLGAVVEKQLKLVKDKIAPSIVLDSKNKHYVNIGTEDEINEVIEVKFDEDIVLAGTKDDVTVLDEDGIKRDVTKVEVITVDKDSKTLRLEVSSIKDSNGEIKPGTYKVELPAKFIKDKYDNEIIKTVFNITKESKDKTVKATASAASNVITVDYDSDMGLSAIDKANYLIDGKALGENSKVYFSGNSKKVKIELADEFITTTGGAILSINDKVLDLKGKGVIKDNGTISISTGFIDNVKPELVSAKKLSNNSFELTFSEVIEDTTLASNAADNDFVVKVDGVSFNYKVTTGVADDNKVVVTTNDTFNLSSKVTVNVTDVLKDISITDKSSVPNKLKEGTLVTVK